MAKRSRKKTLGPLADQIMKAPARLGSDGRGRGGLVGYLQSLAKNDPRLYATKLLAPLLDYEPPEEVKPKKKVFRTLQEVEAEMRARGLPIPERWEFPKNPPKP